MASEPLKSFTQLVAWQEGHKLALEVYRAARAFPKEETFALTNQMQRCAVSITSNIAEGFSRQTGKEKIRFYIISLGSVTELQNQLLIARDIGYLSKTEFDKIAQMTVFVSKLVSGLIKSSRSHPKY